MKVTLKHNLIYILFYITALITSSCKSNRTEQTISQNIDIDIQTKQINFVGQWMGEGNRELMIRNFVRQYEFSNQHINVNLKFPEEIGFNRFNTSESHEFVTKAINNPKVEWDIILINDDAEGISNYMRDDNWAKEYLVDFSTFEEIKKNTIDEIDLDKVKKRWNGIIPGPFLEGQYWALWTNKKVTEKLGIKVKQFGMSIDDFISYLKAVDDYNKKHSDRIIPFQEAGDWTTVFSIVNHLYLSQFENTNEIFEDTLSRYKLDKWHNTLKSLEEISKYNFIGDKWKNQKWNDIKLSTLNEQCLFFSNGSWMYNTWLQADPSKVMNCVPNEYPTFKQSLIYPSSYPIMWGVLKTAPNQKEAIDFLLEMSKPSMAESWVRNTKCPAGIKGNLANANFGVDQYENFASYIQKTYGTNAYKSTENSTLIFGSKYIFEKNYFLEVISGEMTADEAMNKIYERFALELPKEEL